MTIDAGKSVWVSMQSPVTSEMQVVTQLLRDIRKLEVFFHIQDNNETQGATLNVYDGLLEHLSSLSFLLQNAGHQPEAGALLDVYTLSLAPTDFGGLGLDPKAKIISPQDAAEILFLTSAHLEALNSVERAKNPLRPLSTRPAGRRGMTMSEKIFAAHDTTRKGEVKSGDVVRVDVDWIMASELSWRVSRTVFPVYPLQ